MDAEIKSAEHPPLVTQSHHCEICGKDAVSQVATSREKPGYPLNYHRVCLEHRQWFFNGVDEPSSVASTT